MQESDVLLLSLDEIISKVSLIFFSHFSVKLSAIFLLQIQFLWSKWIPNKSAIADFFCIYLFTFTLTSVVIPYLFIITSILI